MHISHSNDVEEQKQKPTADERVSTKETGTSPISQATSEVPPAVQRHTDQEQALARYKALSNDVLSREHSTKTRQEYNRVEARLTRSGVRGNETLLKYCNKKDLSQAQYYVARASLEQKVAREFEARSAQGDIPGALYAGRRLESLRPGKPYDRDNLRQSADYAGDRSESASKRHDTLPSDWRDTAVSAGRNPEAKERLATLALSGCRPSELQKGVQVSVGSDEIKFSITGAKKHGDISGRDRDVVVKKDDCKSPAAWTVLQQKGEGLHEIKASSYSVVKKDMERVKESTGIEASAYNFRHQFASDQRQSGKDREGLAESMGHRSLRSQTAYGHKI